MYRGELGGGGKRVNRGGEGEGEGEGEARGAVKREIL